MQLRSLFANCTSKNLSERKNGLKSKDLKKVRKLSKNRKNKIKRMEYHLGKGKKQTRRGGRRKLVDVEEKGVDIAAQK
jgi:hypothetical protein